MEREEVATRNLATTPGWSGCSEDRSQGDESKAGASTPSPSPILVRPSVMLAKASVLVLSIHGGITSGRHNYNSVV